MAADGFGKIGTAHIDVEGDFTRFYAQANAAGGKVDDVTIGVDADTAKARAKIDGLGDDPIEVPVKPDLDPLRGEFDKFRKKDAPAEGRKSGAAWSKNFANTVKGLNLGQRIFSQIKPAAMIGSLGLITQAGGSAATAILGLTSSLSSLSGAIVLPVSGLLAFVQGMGVTKFAVAGVTDALGGLTEAADPKKLAELTPPARAFVKVLDALKPKLIDFQTKLQGNLFPGLTAAVTRLAPLMAKLEKPLAGTAKAMGDLADRGSRGLAAMVGPIADLLTFNNLLITSFGNTAGVLGKTLVDVLLTARPLILFMATSVDTLVRSLSQNIGGNGLAAFFTATRESLTKFSHLLGSTGRILGSILQASLPFGNELVRILNVNAKALADFLATPKGKKSLRDFFAESMPSILEVGRLVRDVTKDFIKLSHTPGLDKTLGDVRTKLLPALVKLVDVTTREFMPVLVPALTEVVKLFIKFSGTTGALTRITKAIGGAAKALNGFFANHKTILGFANDFATLVAVISIGGLAKMAGLFKNVGIAVRILLAPLRFLISTFTEFAGIGEVILVAFEAIGTAVAAAVAAITAPIALIIAAIASVGIAVFVLVTHFKEWKAGVQIVFQAVGNLARTWAAGVRVIFAGVGAGVRALGGVLQSWRNGVASILASARALFATWWAGVQSIFATARAGISAFVDRVRSLFTGIDLYAAGSAVMHTLLAGLKAGFEKVKEFITGIATWIKDHKGPVSADRQLLVPAGKAIMHGFDSGLHSRWKGVQDWVGNIGGFFKGAISGKSLNGTITDILLGKGGVKDLNNKLGGLLGVPANLIGSGLGGFLHPTSGWPDTLSQVKLIEKLFGVGMTSGLRNYDTVAGPGVSQHTLGQAADFGNSRASDAVLTKLASFMSRLVGPIFKQVIWLDKLWSGGGPINGSFVADHMDHVHLGWQGRKAGGSVGKGRGYQWNERGAEMFVPHGNGYVMNAGRTKELISALKSVARGGNTDNRKVEMTVVSNAADPRAVAGAIGSHLGGAFSLA